MDANSKKPDFMKFFLERFKILKLLRKLPQLSFKEIYGATKNNNREKGPIQRVQ